MKKSIGLISLLVIISLSAFIWWRYFFVFGEGVKAGNLNYFVKKGYICKTYEGRLIQSGIKTKTPGAIQNNEFEFSVESDSLASILEGASGEFLELRYVEYLNPVPWRGFSKYIVTEIVSISEGKNENIIPY